MDISDRIVGRGAMQMEQLRSEAGAKLWGRVYNVVETFRSPRDAKRRKSAFPVMKRG